jgi:hypothetical protein
VNSKVGKEADFRPTAGPNSILKESNDCGNRIADFACSKNVTISSIYFLH